MQPRGPAGAVIRSGTQLNNSQPTSRFIFLFQERRSCQLHTLPLHVLIMPPALAPLGALPHPESPAHTHTAWRVGREGGPGPRPAPPRPRGKTGASRGTSPPPSAASPVPVPLTARRNPCTGLPSAAPPGGPCAPAGGYCLPGLPEKGTAHWAASATGLEARSVGQGVSRVCCV